MANAQSTAATAPTKTEITDEVVQEIAQEALCCVPTVYRALAGLPVRGRVGERVARIIAMKRGGG
jgi:hypothetical protein